MICDALESKSKHAEVTLIERWHLLNFIQGYPPSKSCFNMQDIGSELNPPIETNQVRESVLHFLDY